MQFPWKRHSPKGGSIAFSRPKLIRVVTRSAQFGQNLELCHRTKRFNELNNCPARTF